MSRNYTTISDKITAILGIFANGTIESRLATYGLRLSLISRSILSRLTGGSSTRLQVAPVRQARPKTAPAARIVECSCSHSSLPRPSWRLLHGESEARTKGF
jgi:hypothetical protein